MATTITTPPSAPATTGLSHTATVAALYEAFGRGDVPTILGMLAEDVTWDGDWADNFGQRGHVDHFRPRTGKSQVGAFFAVLATVTVEEFAVLDLLASDRQVVAQVVIALKLPKGGRLRDEELHLWTFGADGRITALRHYIDTATHLAAAAGTDTRMPIDPAGDGPPRGSMGM